MKQISLNIQEMRALLILNEYLQAQQVDGSHRFLDYLPMIETALHSIDHKITAPATKDAA
jgi:hypothetical protein